MTWYLVRHGETEWTANGRLHGWLDSPLTARGQRQAALAAASLSRVSLDAVYTSPLGRAYETASILAEPHGKEPVPVDGLREMGYGWLEGKPLRLFEPDYTGVRFFRPVVALALFLSGESRGAMNRRIVAGLDKLSEKHPSGRVLIVTHWGVLSQILATLVDRDPALWRRYESWAACGITELVRTGAAWRIARLNDSSHLRELKVEP